MTVGELIAVLSAYPAGWRMVVDGYEGDADDIVEVAPRHVEIDGNCKVEPDGVAGPCSAHDVGMGRHVFVDDPTATPVVWLRREYYRGECG